MKILFDTHILLWAAGAPEKSPVPVLDILDAADTEPVFSAASIWDVAIKSGLGRTDFQVDAHALRRGLLDNGYEELAITGRHAAALVGLPSLHKDPFDRILVAQAVTERIVLVTADTQLAQYPGVDFRP